MLYSEFSMAYIANVLNLSKSTHEWSGEKAGGMLERQGRVQILYNLIKPQKKFILKNSTHEKRPLCYVFVIDLLFPLFKLSLFECHCSFPRRQDMRELRGALNSVEVAWQEARIQGRLEDHCDPMTFATALAPGNRLLGSAE